MYNNLQNIKWWIMKDVKPSDSVIDLTVTKDMKDDFIRSIKDIDGSYPVNYNCLDYNQAKEQAVKYSKNGYLHNSILAYGKNIRDNINDLDANAYGLSDPVASINKYPFAAFNIAHVGYFYIANKKNITPDQETLAILQKYHVIMKKTEYDKFLQEHCDKDIPEIDPNMIASFNNEEFVYTFYNYDDKEALVHMLKYTNRYNATQMLTKTRWEATIAKTQNMKEHDVPAWHISLCAIIANSVVIAPDILTNNVIMPGATLLTQHLSINDKLEKHLNDKQIKAIQAETSLEEFSIFNALHLSVDTAKIQKTSTLYKKYMQEEKELDNFLLFKRNVFHMSRFKEISPNLKNIISHASIGFNIAGVTLPPRNNNNIIFHSISLAAHIGVSVLYISYATTGIISFNLLPTALLASTSIIYIPTSAINKLRQSHAGRRLYSGFQVLAYTALFIKVIYVNNWLTKLSLSGPQSFSVFLISTLLLKLYTSPRARNIVLHPASTLVLNAFGTSNFGVAARITHKFAVISLAEHVIKNKFIPWLNSKIHASRIIPFAQTSLSILALTFACRGNNPHLFSLWWTRPDASKISLLCNVILLKIHITQSKPVYLSTFATKVLFHNILSAKVLLSNKILSFKTYLSIPTISISDTLLGRVCCKGEVPLSPDQTEQNIANIAFVDPMIKLLRNDNIENTRDIQKRYMIAISALGGSIIGLYCILKYNPIGHYCLASAKVSKYLLPNHKSIKWAIIESQAYIARSKDFASHMLFRTFGAQQPAEIIREAVQSSKSVVLNCLSLFAIQK